MTGCGKTTVGKKAAEMLSCEFVDIDEAIVRETGKSIKELFALYGEEGFRKIETDSLASHLQKEGFCIVSCGGGIILREENRKLLREKAYTVWIRRPPKLVLENPRVLERPPVNGDKNSYYTLLQQRMPLYKESAVTTLQNRDAFATAKQLCRILQK